MDSRSFPYDLANVLSSLSNVAYFNQSPVIGFLFFFLIDCLSNHLPFFFFCSFWELMIHGIK